MYCPIGPDSWYTFQKDKALELLPIDQDVVYH